MQAETVQDEYRDKHYVKKTGFEFFGACLFGCIKLSVSIISYPLSVN